LSTLSPVALMAQLDLDDEIDAELARIYSGNPSNNSSQQDSKSSNLGSSNIQINIQSSPQVTAKSDTTAKLDSTSELQNKSDENSVDLKSDTSGINQLRSSRKQLEIQNELKVVEKLETSRLEDEKTRTDRLFGNKNNTEYSGENDVVVESKVESLDREAVRSEIRQTLESLKKEEATQDTEVGKTYFSAVLGLGEYYDVVNVRGTYSLGFSIGQMTSKSLAVEGSFLFSEFDVEQRDGGYVCDYYYGCIQYPRITRMNQYQGGVTAKYIPFEGAFRPFVGGSVAYTYRTFSDVQFAIPNNDAQSHALDVGLLAGFDLQLSQDFSLGFDFKAFTNVTSRATNKGLQQSFSRSVYNSDTPIESLDYTQMGITGKFSF